MTTQQEHFKRFITTAQLPLSKAQLTLSQYV